MNSKKFYATMAIVFKAKSFCVWINRNWCIDRKPVKSDPLITADIRIPAPNEWISFYQVLIVFLSPAIWENSNHDFFALLSPLGEKFVHGRKGSGGNEFKHYPICARAHCMQIAELLKRRDSATRGKCLAFQWKSAVGGILALYWAGFSCGPVQIGIGPC